MADTQDDWRQLFDTYRYEVIRAGFGAWDEAAFADNDPADDGEEGRVYRRGLPDDVSRKFERYATRFVRMLACIESGSLERLILELNDRVRAQDGSGNIDVLVQSEDGRVRPLSERSEHSGIVEAFSALNEILFSPEDPEPLQALVRA